jgi:arsenate reductase (thioredoxin)
MQIAFPVGLYYWPAILVMMRILFVCSGNSCRSQMAEGWARALRAGRIEPYSAGIEVHGLHPDAVRVMAEKGVDISGQRSKSIGDICEIDFDLIVTLSGRARTFYSMSRKTARTIDIRLDSPPRLAAEATTAEERLAPYRRVRDTVRAIVESLPDSLSEQLAAQ